MALTKTQLERYARHILLRDVGGQGQQKLLASKVLVIGAGGLGSPLLLYLAAAGVGTLGVVDDDKVDLSNLQRQVLHTTARVGAAKTDSALAAIGDLNPDVTVVPHEVRLTPGNARDLVRGYDLVADGCDNFDTRLAVNDACYHEKAPLVSAAVGEFDGQLTTLRAYENGNPCYRCLFPEAPPPGSVPTCAEAGILGVIPGVMGSLQALEVIKELLGIGDSLVGKLLLYDGLAARMRVVGFPRDPECALCGAAT